jgi:hypothetical protein
VTFAAHPINQRVERPRDDLRGAIRRMGISMDRTIKSTFDQSRPTTDGCVAGIVAAESIGQQTVTINIEPTASSPGHFLAKLASNCDVLVASSRTPFLDAARRLLELGHAADTVLVMKHGQTESLRNTIGIAAALTVKETENGPAFRRYEGPRRLSVAPPIAPTDMTGVLEPPAQNGRTDEVEGSP